MGRLARWTPIALVALTASPLAVGAQSRAERRLDRRLDDRRSAISTLTLELDDLTAGLGPALASVGPVISSVGPTLAALLPVISSVGPTLAAVLPALPSVQIEVGPTRIRTAPPQSWDDQDPADSLYRAARGALNRGNYNQAAYLFSQIRERFRRSSYAPDAYYWEAFARYRKGSSEDLRTALRLIERQDDDHPDAATHDDAQALATRIEGELAKKGDIDAREQIVRRADRVAEPRPPHEAREPEQARRPGGRCRDDDDDEKMAALNALLQMNEDRAMPILKKVMARRDEGAVCLRRKAVFLISQHAGPDAEAALLAAVRNDPDAEVREQAVFWLSQVNTEHAAIALDSILRTSDDPVVQEKAIFALSQHDSDRSMRSLRDYALNANAPRNLRENAIFWLGQSGRADNSGFLKSLFKSVRDESLKDKIIFSISQQSSRDNQRWLIDIATDPNEETEIRKKAIFWAGQSNVPLTELFGLYDRIPDREIRDGLIFAYSQRGERAAIDKLVEIAKTEKDRELRKKALFWLGQSHDPRVAQILEDILNKP
jgi:TolA-binding protein